MNLGQLCFLDCSKDTYDNFDSTYCTRAQAANVHGQVDNTVDQLPSYATIVFTGKSTYGQEVCISNDR